ncbi:hypothetical protein [Leptolyngbya sp. FACHB-261]|nr:hypothetical protein [Leptolyngbya sp. FACHB-261]MBD2099442.1 hypothetical protein [Leptolyngbya sp. FACHB-261]
MNSSLRKLTLVTLFVLSLASAASATVPEGIRTGPTIPAPVLEPANR